VSLPSRVPFSESKLSRFLSYLSTGERFLCTISKHTLFGNTTEGVNFGAYSEMNVVGRCQSVSARESGRQDAFTAPSVVASSYPPEGCPVYFESGKISEPPRALAEQNYEGGGFIYLSLILPSVSLSPDVQSEQGIFLIRLRWSLMPPFRRYPCIYCSFH
jgi:hypothetical protein